MCFHLGLNDAGKMDLTLRLGGKEVNRWPVNSLEELNTTLEKVMAEAGLNANDAVVMCSSSLDWPEDYTADPVVIALCDKIRGT